MFVTIGVFALTVVSATCRCMLRQTPPSRQIKSAPKQTVHRRINSAYLNIMVTRRPSNLTLAASEKTRADGGAIKWQLLGEVTATLNDDHWARLADKSVPTAADAGYLQFLFAKPRSVLRRRFVLLASISK